MTTAKPTAEEVKKGYQECKTCGGILLLESGFEVNTSACTQCGEHVLMEAVEKGRLTAKHVFQLLPYREGSSTSNRLLALVRAEDDDYLLKIKIKKIEKTTQLTEPENI